MLEPIKPSEVTGIKKAKFPDEVIEAFNELIAKKYTNGKARVIQNDVIELICDKLEIPRSEFDFDWLNIEEIYRAAGWKVGYDNETYKVFFTFYH